VWVPSGGAGALARLFCFVCPLGELTNRRPCCTSNCCFVVFFAWAVCDGRDVFSLLPFPCICCLLVADNVALSLLFVVSRVHRPACVSPFVLPYVVSCPVLFFPCPLRPMLMFGLAAPARRTRHRKRDPALDYPQLRPLLTPLFPSQLPKGVSGLAAEMRAIGMNLGLWVEPEAVSPNSDLFRDHPDWVLRIPGRAASVLARYQMVLDLSRADVRDYLFERLSALFGSGITYVKWDFNRWIAPAYSAALLPVEQGTVSHKYICGVYSLLGRLTAAYPAVLVEACAAGGGRFDCGMLAYCPQVWTSDNTDAASRVRIQWGTSVAYPPSAIACHVSDSPNHQTLRAVSFKTRASVALFGVYGMEQDVRLMSVDEAAAARRYNLLAVRLGPLIHHGDLYRLWSPFAKGEDGTGAAAWMTVAPDRSAALVTVVSLAREVGSVMPRLCLRGLQPDALYLVEEIVGGDQLRDLATGKVVAGSGPSVFQFTDRASGLARVAVRGLTLMKAGLPLRMEFDNDAVMFHLSRQQMPAVAGAVVGAPVA